MPNRLVFSPTSADANLAEQIRKFIKESRELLKQPPPDTFLDRKTQKPFPGEDDPMQRADVQSLLRSELQPPE